MNTELVKKIAAGTAIVLGGVGALLVLRTRAVMTEAEVVEDAPESTD